MKSSNEKDADLQVQEKISVKKLYVKPERE